MESGVPVNIEPISPPLILLLLLVLMLLIVSAETEGKSRATSISEGRRRGKAMASVSGNTSGMVQAQICAFTEEPLVAHGHVEYAEKDTTTHGTPNIIHNI